jgi:hypothetical protein
VKPSAALICVAAWILALVTQLVFALGLSTDKVVTFGVDITQASHALQLKQLLYVAIGLASALAAYANTRWRFALLIFSCLFYLLHWFPWRLVGSYGIVATTRSMYVLGSTEGLRFISLVRDVVLPIAFAAVIVHAIFERRKVRSLV